MYDMDGHLARDNAAAAIAAGLEQLAPDLRREIERLLEGVDSPADVEWPEHALLAGRLADALEALMPASADWTQASSMLDTATMLRVRAGGVARRGGPFTWRDEPRASWAVGMTGTSWDVIPRGSGYGVVVAQGDHPDWGCARLDDAKRIAEEIDARPKFPRHLGIEEVLFDD